MIGDGFLAQLKCNACLSSAGRMGNCRRALQMITEELQDVDKAIEFAKEQDDAELWEDLISYSIDKPRT